jgi:hypothetical protein
MLAQGHGAHVEEIDMVDRNVFWHAHLCHKVLAENKGKDKSWWNG